MCPHNTGNSRSAPPPPPSAAEAARPPPHAAQFMPYTQQASLLAAALASRLAKMPRSSTEEPQVLHLVNSILRFLVLVFVTSTIIDKHVVPDREFGSGVAGCVRAGLVYLLLAHVGCSCLYTCTYRRKLRIMYGLKEEPCGDYLVHCCCHFCAISQGYRELQNHGFDPSVGWLANADRLNRGGARASPMAPPTVATAMAR
ncbi:hypothetical protein V6N13_046508 [Hibiscus sabdariffa]|uniref:Uncharacterized protein n=1 Tax=Hibiscus sabdariffa TaxID=183260 RepID=A0ABR2NZR9_9ROSI